MGPRAPVWLVERMVVAAIGMVNAYTDRLMRALGPLLEARYGKRHDSVIPLLLRDAISIPPEVFAAEHVPTLAEIFRLLDDIAAAPMSRQFLERMFRLVDNQALEDLQRVVPVSLAEVLPGGTQMREAWIERNTLLIRLEERAQQEVRAIIEAPIVEGVRVEEIAKQIEERMGVVRSRAELIARDQTLKVYGSIQEARQTDAGIVEYIWSTSQDERVRHRHSELEGTTQRWDSPPIVDKRTGRREHPGLDFQCRCSAIPVLPTGDEPPDSETRPSVRFAARAAENDT
jgi:SPP1 gp7 family putative phage head morphogenesis protein